MGSIIHAFPDAAAARLAGRLLNQHSAKEIADAIGVLIDVLDMLGGDPDAEENDLEDSFALSANAASDGKPGCPISDPPRMMIRIRRLMTCLATGTTIAKRKPVLRGRSMASTRAGDREIRRTARVAL